MVFLCGLVAMLISWTVTGLAVTRDVRRERREALGRLNEAYRELCASEPAP
jgi:hypothetical protein